ncbi:MAG: hypothetical protein WA952_10395 [Lewinella sp.]
MCLQMDAYQGVKRDFLRIKVYNHGLRGLRERRIGGYPPLLHFLHSPQGNKDTLGTPMAATTQSYSRQIGHFR